MKIGYFSSKFPYPGELANENYQYGGSIIATYYLAREAAKRHDVKVFTTARDAGDLVEKRDGLEIFRYGSDFKFLSSNISLGQFSKPLSEKVDLVHISFDVPPGPFAGLRYAKKKKLPVVLTYHGDYDGSYGNIARRLGVGLHSKFLVEKLLSYASVIISPSERYVCRSRFLSPHKDKITVIPNGIVAGDFELPISKDECRKRLNLPIDKKVVLFFGILAPYKSPDLLLRALPEMLNKEPDIFLVYAGKGVMREELEKLAVSLGVQKNVRFEGFVADSLKALYYKAADVYCLPSTINTECYPIAILEAMASGAPVIASDIGGIPDIVKDGFNGLLVPPNDVSALANAITQLMRDETDRERLGKNGKRVISEETYSWSRIAALTENVYDQVIEGCN